MHEVILEVKKRGSHIQVIKDVNTIKYLINNHIIDTAPYNLKNLAKFSARVKSTINYLNK